MDPREQLALMRANERKWAREARAAAHRVGLKAVSRKGRWQIVDPYRNVVEYGDGYTLHALNVISYCEREEKD